MSCCHTARNSKGRRRSQDGFKAHVAVEPGTGLVTACALTKAAGPGSTDAEAGIDPLTGERTHLQVLGDSAYATGKALATLEETGHEALVNPRPAVPGGISITDFTVQETAGTVTCPNGLTRPISAKRSVTFGAACRDCPLRERCTTSASGRSVVLHEHVALMRQHRAHAADPAWQEQYRQHRQHRQHRPMVERSPARLVRGGNRRLRYRGVAKNNLWVHHRTAALNLRDLLQLGLTVHDGAWALA